MLALFIAACTTSQFPTLAGVAALCFAIGFAFPTRGSLSTCEAALINGVWMVRFAGWLCCGVTVLLALVFLILAFAEAATPLGLYIFAIITAIAANSCMIVDAWVVHQRARHATEPQQSVEL